MGHLIQFIETVAEFECYNQSMTAILTVFHLSGKPVQKELMRQLLNANTDNAQDGFDIQVAGNIGFASQYLWVTPQEQFEKQPLWDQDERIALVGSLRLDNRQFLRDVFQLDAEQKQSISDASLVLHAYQHWDTDCVKHLSGDFAFIIWDAAKQSLFLARDQLGVKNLSYLVTQNTFMAASEIEHLMAFPGLELVINEGKLSEYLANSFHDQQESFFQGIQYLPPAHALQVSQQGVRLWRYWQVDPERRVHHKTDEAYAEQLIDILTGCVRDRLRSTGPIAVSMSGGLDSTSVTAIASRLLSSDQAQQAGLPVYSYAFTEITSCDERAYISQMVRDYPLSPNSIFCDQEWTLRDLQSWPVYREYPTSDPYPRLPLAVMRAAQQDGVKLLLTGYFGDVLFTGQSYWLADMIRFGQLDLIRKSLRPSGNALSRLRTSFHAGLLPLLPRSWKNAYHKLRNTSDPISSPGLHPDFIRRTQLAERLRKDESWKVYKAPGQWDRLSRLTLNLFSQGAAATDKTYHQHGIEISAPFWDRRLVEFVMALPAYQLGRPGCDRYILRNALRGILPEPVRLRTQRTVFSELLQLGILKNETETVRRLLHDPLLVRLNIYQKEWLQAEFEAGANWTADGYYFWKALSLELWLRKVYNEPLPE